MQSNFINLSRMRHSVYHLGRNLKIAPQEVVRLIEKAVKLSPTPFNNQSVRVVILLNRYQNQVWQLIGKTVSQLVGTTKYQKSVAPKIHSFKHGSATVLFYTDKGVVRKTAQKFAAFPTHNFVEWSEQAQGNAQYSVWVALAEQQIGASIHHYGALFGSQVADALDQKFQVPKTWQLRAEMVLGSIQKPAHTKAMIDDRKRFKVFK